MTTFTIAPRFADKAGTIPMPTWRNVMDEGGAYVGKIVMHDGTWTPLFSTADTESVAIVDVLTQAAAQMNAGEYRDVSAP